MATSKTITAATSKTVGDTTDGYDQVGICAVNGEEDHREKEYAEAECHSDEAEAKKQRSTPSVRMM